jgi:hypothetical protein
MRRIGVHGILKVLVVLFAIISLALTSITTINYSNVMDARIKVPGTIYVESVRIPEIVDESSNVLISVVVNITNPTNIDIFVYDITYQFYMNNLSNPLDLDSSSSWDAWAVGLGGFTLPVDSGIRVPSKTTRSIYANMTVIGGVEGSMAMTNLNVTDSQGNYHPLVIASLRYTFEHIDVQEVVRGIFFYSEDGIPPGSGG